MTATSSTQDEQACRTEYNDHHSLTYTVVEAVAVVTGQDLFEVGPLHETVDPDALAQLFTESDSGRVEFTIDGCHVTIEATGEISVCTMD